MKTIETTKKFRIRANTALPGFAALAAIALAGCWSVKPPKDWRVEVDQEHIKNAPPIPAGEAVDAAAEINNNPEVRIDPTTAQGYHELPEDMKGLYGPNPKELDIEDVVTETLEHNRDIKIQNYTLQISEANIPISKSVYDTFIRSRAQFRRDATQTASGLSASGVRRSREAQTTVSQLLPTGAVLDLTHTYNRVNQEFFFQSLNPVVAHAVGATLTQPLLRGFGPAVTNVDINIAQVDYKISAAELEIRIQNQLAEALRLYWELVFANEDYKVQLISYTAALDLLRINKAKEAAGVAPPTEVLQALARAEQRREAIIQARQTVRNLEDRLKRTMFFQDDDTPAWGLELRPVSELSWREMDVNLAEVFDEAYENRPEMRALAAALDRNDYEQIRARNDLLPQLDIFGGIRYNGIGQTDHEAFDELDEFDYDDRIVGFEFSVPIQNRRARYRLQQTEISRERAKEDYLRQRDIVTLDLRDAIRGLRTARERIDVARARVESEQANLDAETKRLEVGVSTSFQVLEFQERLAAAQDAYARAVVDYNQAQVQLERARGTLLPTFGVNVVCPDLEPEVKPVIWPVGLD